MKTTPNIGLALGGGTALGIAHVGVLTAFAERGVRVSAVSGTSAGSFVASCFAFGVPVSRMAEIARTLDWKKIARFGRSLLGWRTNEPLSGFLKSILGDVCIEDAPLPLALIATDIETYEKVVLRSGQVSEAVRASTCIPGLFTPVAFEGRLLVDGGLSENVPLSPLRTMGADIVVGVNLVAQQHTFRPRHLLHVLNNTYTTLSRHRDRTLSAEADLLIEPDLANFDPMRFEHAEELFEAGYRATCEILPLLQEKIAHFEHAHESFLQKVWRTLQKPVF